MDISGVCTSVETLYLERIKKQVDIDLEKQAVSAKVLLSNLRTTGENYRVGMECQDPLYAPFYYHLGKYVSPGRFLEVGFDLGLESGCFFQSCKTVKDYFAFRLKTDQFFSPRIGLANIREHYRGSFGFYDGLITDEPFQSKLHQKWDFIVVNYLVGYDEHRICLDALWSGLLDDGILVVEHITSDKSPSKKSFYDFCKIASREPVVIKTRYGTGLVQK